MARPRLHLFCKIIIIIIIIIIINIQNMTYIRSFWSEVGYLRYDVTEKNESDDIYMVYL